MTAILVACGGSLIAAAVSIITLLLQRKWVKEDRNNGVLAKLSEIEKSLSAHIDQNEQDSAKQARTRILRFADECGRGVQHSQEYFESVMDDITAYNLYCSDNPSFKNSKAKTSIKIVEDIYEDCLKNHKFA